MRVGNHLEVTETGIKAFMPWMDPSWQPGKATRALGWAAFGLSAIAGSFPGALAAAMSLDVMRSIRPGPAPEADLADTVEC